MSADEYSDLGLADIEPVGYDGSSFELMLSIATSPDTPPVAGLEVPDADQDFFDNDDIQFDEEIQLADDDADEFDADEDLNVAVDDYHLDTDVNIDGSELDEYPELEDDLDVGTPDFDDSVGFGF